MALTVAGEHEAARRAFAWAPGPAAGRRLLADEVRRRRGRGRQRRDQHVRLPRRRRLAPLAGTPRPGVRRPLLARGPSRPGLGGLAPAALRRDRLGAGVGRRPAGPGQRGRPARGVVERAPRAARRRLARRADRRPAARLGAGRRPAAARPRASTRTGSSTSRSSRWTGTTRCWAGRSVARRPRPCSPPAGTTSWCPGSASAASPPTRGSPAPRPASWCSPWGDRRPERARALFADVQHLREADGRYGTGLVFPDGVHWPGDHSTYTAAAVVLAADALADATPGADIMRAGRWRRLRAVASTCGCPSADRVAGPTRRTA